jgi:hypothetical protein
MKGCSLDQRSCKRIILVLTETSKSTRASYISRANIVKTRENLFIKCSRLSEWILIWGLALCLVIDIFDVFFFLFPQLCNFSKRNDALCLNHTMNSCAMARRAPVISIHHVGDIFSRFIHP